MLFVIRKASFFSMVLISVALGVIVLQNGFSESEDISSALRSDSYESPKGFRSIMLGMEIEAVKEALQQEYFFNYSGPPDVSLSPTRNQTIIETEGSVFIERGYFQFVSEKLVILTLMMDPLRVDYFSMFTVLNNKYGNPVELSPRDAVWEFDEVRLSLERPVILKYQDISEDKDLVGDSDTSVKLQNLTLPQFLELF